MENSVNNYRVGDIVRATAGRGSGRLFLVVAVEGIFADLSDGDTRKLNHLKKKKFRHLLPTGCFSDEAVRLHASGQLKDADIRSILKEVK